MENVFFIGATGHIGHALVRAITARFPDIQIVALVRDQDKANDLQRSFRNVRAVIGDFQCVQLIKSESRAACVVINTSPDGLPGSATAIEAIIHGLASRSQKAYYIHTSGALVVGQNTNGHYSTDKVWSDVTDIEEIKALSLEAYHQRTDDHVRKSHAAVNVAIVAPTVVHGLGPLPGNQVPITVRGIVATMKEIRAGFVLSEGKNILGYVHVDDVADVYVQLLADAVRGAEASRAELWGPDAFYFANSEELDFATYMAYLVSALRANGTLDSDLIKQIGTGSDPQELDVVVKTSMAHGCGWNVRCRSDRAADLLGWRPKAGNVKATILDVVRTLMAEK